MSKFEFFTFLSHYVSGLLASTARLSASFMLLMKRQCTGLAGSQRQRLTVLPDTGSGLFWVLDPQACPSAIDHEGRIAPEERSTGVRCGGKTPFRHGASATFQSVDRPWNVSYGHGDNGYRGTSGRDTVRVGARAEHEKRIHVWRPKSST